MTSLAVLDYKQHNNTAKVFKIRGAYHHASHVNAFLGYESTGADGKVCHQEHANM